MTILQDAAFVRVVEAGEKLNQGRLAGAVFADQRDDFTCVQREAEMAHSPSLGAGIDEAHILEHESLTDRLGERTRTFRRQDFGPDLEEGKQVIEIERLARGGRKTRQKTFKETRRRRNEPARKVRSSIENKLRPKQKPFDALYCGVPPGAVSGVTLGVGSSAFGGLS